MTLKPRRWLLTFVILACLRSAPGLCLPKELHIEATDAPRALLDFSRQTGIFIVFTSSVAGITTHPVHGTFEPETALAQMLADSGLEFTRGPYGFQVHKKAPNPEITIRARPDRPALPSIPSGLERSAADIEKTGIITIPDYLQTLPQVTTGPCDALVGNSRDTRQNAAQTCGVNIHGLSARATAVTLNGEPLAMSGTNALYVGISHIPLAAVEQLEIDPDNPSLLSAGSPGGVVNFKLLDDFDGYEVKMRYVPEIAGAVGEKQIAQLKGWHWGDTKGVLVLEYDSRDALTAAERAQGTSDLRSFGGSDFRSPAGSPGTIILPEGTWPIPTLPPGTRLTAQDLTQGPENLYNTRLGTDLLPAESLLSALLAGHREFDNGTHVGCHSLLSWRRIREAQPAVADIVVVPPSNPFYVNPLAGKDPVVVEHGFLADIGPTLQRDQVLDDSMACETTFMLGSTWQLQTSFAYSFERLHEQVSGLLNTVALESALADPSSATAFDVFQPGVTHPQTLQGLNGSSVFTSLSDIIHWRALATRPIQNLLLGASRLTLGLELQRESLRSNEHAVNLTPDTSTRLHRQLAAAVTTACMPFLNRSQPCGSEDAAVLDQINLLAGGRYERYSDGVGDWSHSISLQWRSPSGLTVSASWARSVERASLADLSNAQNTTEIVSMIDPRTPAGYSAVLVLSGGNPTLRPEVGNDITLNATFEHEGPHAYIASIHYFHDDISGQIDAPVLGANSLWDPTIRELVTLSPTASTQTAVCQQGQYNQGLAACENTSIGAIIDDRLRNLSRLTTEGMDVAWNQNMGTFLGDWNFSLHATYLDRYVLHQPTGRENLVNTMGYPLHFRALTALSWHHGIWSANLFANFRGSYRDTTGMSPREIREWTTTDLSISASIPSAGVLALKNLECSAAVRNLFDKTAPFANNPAGLAYDPFNANLLGRYLTVAIAAKF